MEALLNGTKFVLPKARAKARRHAEVLQLPIPTTTAPVLDGILAKKKTKENFNKLLGVRGSDEMRNRIPVMLIYSNSRARESCSIIISKTTLICARGKEEEEMAFTVGLSCFGETRQSGTKVGGGGGCMDENECIQSRVRQKKRHWVAIWMCTVQHIFCGA